MKLSIIRWGGEPPPQSYHQLHPSTLNWSHFSKYTKWVQTLQRFTHAIPSAYSYFLHMYLPTAQNLLIILQLAHPSPLLQRLP